MKYVREIMVKCLCQKGDCMSLATAALICENRGYDFLVCERHMFLACRDMWE